ncbi:MAG: adenylosuccinate lyase, partial [Phycisphaerales bacterium]|nr:adenylosuccinate lyase [Phycisphaerales bacterium]
FLALFNNDPKKVDRLDQLVIEKLSTLLSPSPSGRGVRGEGKADREGISDLFPLPSDLYPTTGQTYPRLIDAQVINSLAVAAAAAHKFANDIRLLAHRKEIEEPFEKDQVGSSAMAYKRNPMRCERVTGMARFVISLASSPLNTAATQWLERTLDDSSNRRMVLPEAFLALDGILDVLHNVASGLVVYPQTIEANLQAELPFMATENILMAAAQAGADRQQAHELIRKHSQAAAQRVKSEGGNNDLIDRLRKEPMLKKIPWELVLDPTTYTGLASEQVDRFIADVIQPIRARYAEHLSSPATALRV